MKGNSKWREDDLTLAVGGAVLVHAALIVGVLLLVAGCGARLDDVGLDVHVFKPSASSSSSNPPSVPPSETPALSAGS